MDFDTWWESKSLYYGGDDGVDFLNCEDIERMAANKPSPKAKPIALVIDLQPEQFMVEIMWCLK